MANAKLKIIIVIQTIALVAMVYKLKQYQTQNERDENNLDGQQPQSIVEVLHKTTVNKVHQEKSASTKVEQNKTSINEQEKEEGVVINSKTTDKIKSLSVSVQDNKPKKNIQSSTNFTEKQTKANGTKVRVLSNYASYPDNKPLQLSCNTCAFVTNSGHVIGKGLGSIIDSKDCVIRSNDAPVTGYEADVGSKTTIRTTDIRSLKILTGSYLKNKTNFPNLETTAVVQVKIYDIENSLGNAKKKIPFLKSYSVIKPFFKSINELYKNLVVNSSKIEQGTWVSNGFYSIAIAHDICNEVHVYGISEADHCKEIAEKKIKDSPYHYYKTDLKECEFFNQHSEKDRNHHLFTKEKLAFNQLRLKWGNLFFHAPEWTSKKQEKSKTKQKPIGLT